MDELEAACRDQDITLYVLPPGSAKLHGCVERFNRTPRNEFWASYGGMYDLSTIRFALHRWTGRYNALKPHASLAYQTSLEFYQSLQGA